MSDLLHLRLKLQVIRRMLDFDKGRTNFPAEFKRKPPFSSLGLAYVLVSFKLGLGLLYLPL